MTLRKKTLSIIGMSFAGLLLALYVTSQVIVLGGFARQEEQDTRLNMERVRSAIADDLASLMGITRDWASWDDTYTYIEDHNEAYYQSNLAVHASFINNRLNLMTYVDASGRIVFSKGYDFNKEQDTAAPPSLAQHLSPSSPLLVRDAASGVSGLLSLPEGPMLIASEQILTSAGEGPARGSVIFGRFLDTTEIGRLSRSTLYSLTAYRASDPQMPGDFSEALAGLSHDSNILVRPLNAVTVAGYTVFADIYGKPALVLRAEMPRSVYAQGQSTVLYFVGALLLFSVVFSLVMILLLEKSVLSRLARLSAGVSRIGESGDLSARMPAAGKDELSSLATNINAMLETVERSQQSLWESEKRFRSVFENAFDPITILDAQGRVVDANPTTCALLGVSREELSSKTVNDLIQPERVSGSLRNWQTLMEQGELKGESQLVSHDGQTKQIEYFLKANFLPGYHLATARDVTERRALEKQLEYQAFHDPLTNLPNRVLFTDRLAHSLARSARTNMRVGVLYLDLDDFKVINDTLGHRVGDQLLIAVSERLMKSLRRGDSIARLGGDEFIVLMEEISDEGEAEQIAERVAERLRTSFMLEDTEVVVSASMGIAISYSSHDTIDNLLRDADVAMYEAKRHGKARYAIFNPSMNARAWERLETEIELRRAVEREEFTVHYQPVVHLETGRVLEVEALVRWDHPQRGVVSPAHFIPLAEETGKIVQIGQWVLDQACKQVRAWQMQSPDSQPLVLSVNLSGRQFQQPELVKEIARALGSAGLDPSCLKLEITETVALDHTGATADTLAALKELGIRLAIDDFGTGYSALSYLKRYPVDTLKIDRSFIHGLGNDPEDTAIVHAVIAFAKTLNLHVTAEGIETHEQLAQLKALGCDYGQGFYFSQPLPPEVLTEMFLAALDNGGDKALILDKLTA